MNYKHETHASIPEKNERNTSKSRVWEAISPELIAAFFIPGVIHDIITNANYGEDCLMGFRVSMGRNFGFSLTCLVAIEVKVKSEGDFFL